VSASRVERTLICQECGSLYTRELYDWEVQHMRCSAECATATARQWASANADRTALAHADKLVPAPAPARVRPGQCGREIRHADGSYGTCAQRKGHKDKCRSQAQLDAKNRARDRRRW
jgi:hypothetical protein